MAYTNTLKETTISSYIPSSGDTPRILGSRTSGDICVKTEVGDLASCSSRKSNLLCYAWIKYSFWRMSWNNPLVPCARESTSSAMSVNNWCRTSPRWKGPSKAWILKKKNSILHSDYRYSLDVVQRIHLRLFWTARALHNKHSLQFNWYQHHR